MRTCSLYFPQALEPKRSLLLRNGVHWNRLNRCTCLHGPRLGARSTGGGGGGSGIHRLDDGLGRLPREMMGDRDPDTGERFPTVAAMREKKLRDWLAGAALLPFTFHVACRDYLLDAGFVPSLHVNHWKILKQHMVCNYSANLGCAFACLGL